MSASDETSSGSSSATRFLMSGRFGQCTTPPPAAGSYPEKSVSPPASFVSPSTAANAVAPALRSGAGVAAGTLGAPAVDASVEARDGASSIGSGDELSSTAVESTGHTGWRRRPGAPQRHPPAGCAPPGLGSREKYGLQPHSTTPRLPKHRCGGLQLPIAASLAGTRAAVRGRARPSAGK